MRTVFHQLSVIDSTNRWAKKACTTFDPEALTVVTAEGQTQGYGQFGRRWLSPVGQNFYGTFCFALPKGCPHLCNAGQVVGVVMARLLDRMDFKALLKWPNDLLIHGKKVGGILCETVDTWVLAGIGMNVNMGPEWLPEIAQPVTSLRLERGAEMDLAQFSEQFALSMSDAVEIYKSEGLAPFYGDYCRYGAHKPGDQLRLRAGGELMEAQFVSIDDLGRLHVQRGDGTRLIVPSGELQ